MKKLTELYLKLIGWFAPVILTPFLLGLRICFGLESFHAGWGKLHNIQTPIDYFTQLHIPFPVANAWLVGYTETLGGILLLLGLFSRPAAFAVFINMTVAYLTTEHDALGKLFTAANADDFISAAPFGIWLTALLVLAVGPGLLSIDGIVKVIYRFRYPVRKATASPVPAVRIPTAPPVQIAPPPRS